MLEHELYPGDEDVISLKAYVLATKTTLRTESFRTFYYPRGKKAGPESRNY